MSDLLFLFSKTAYICFHDYAPRFFKHRKFLLHSCFDKVDGCSMDFCLLLPRFEQVYGMALSHLCFRVPVIPNFFHQGSCEQILIVSLSESMGLHCEISTINGAVVSIPTFAGYFCTRQLLRVAFSFRQNLSLCAHMHSVRTSI